MREMDGEVTLGAFRLDLAHGRLIRDGVVRDLRPQAFRALKVLIRYRGHLVDYPQMIHEAWDVHVSKHTVATTINELKSILEEYGSWITCRAKVGYCLEIPASNDLMRQGWHYWNQYTRTGFESALRYFQEAAQLNPTDFRAYEAIASTYLMLAGFLMRAPSEMHASFVFASERALSLAGPTVTLRVDRAFGLCVFERRLREAESELLVLRPKNADSVHIQVRLAIILLASGRLEDARSFMHSAKAADPLAPELAFLEIVVRLFGREFEAAVECGKHSVEMHPSAEIGRAFYAEALDFAGQRAEALNQYRLAIAMSPDTGWIRADLARCLALGGHKAEALSILEDLRRWRETNYIDAYHMALLFDALGFRDSALCEIERAFNENSYALLFSILDAKAEPLRSDARFETIRRRASNRQ
jgi:DNA-binding winged helix-turn-helix (wHTH) protein